MLGCQDVMYIHTGIQNQHTYVHRQLGFRAFAVRKSGIRREVTMICGVANRHSLPLGCSQSPLVRQAPSAKDADQPI